MTLLRGLKYRLSQSMTEAKVRKGNRQTVSKSNVKYGLMYIGDPEAQEYGGNDPDRWFIFKNMGRDVTFFPTLDGLLHAIQTQLKPLNIYGSGHIYKITGGNKEPYAEMYLRYSPWFAGGRFYYSNGRVVPKNKSIMWVDGKYGSDKEIYAVEDDGKKIRVTFKDEEDIPPKKTTKTVTKKVTKTATKTTPKKKTVRKK